MFKPHPHWDLLLIIAAGSVVLFGFVVIVGVLSMFLPFFV